MKVLFINTNDTSGGAARAAVRVMRGVQQCGIEAQMFVKEKNSNASDVIDLYHFVPKNLLYRVCDWAATKLKINGNIINGIHIRTQSKMCICQICVQRVFMMYCRK